MRIDLNCDMGESFGAYKLGMDEEVMQYITSANIACGYHAGDPQVMEATVRMALAQGVGIGAHPGYPDLMGFGRRNMDCTRDQIRTFVIYQMGALQGFCAAAGTSLAHVKPHGNLYLTAVENEMVATAIAEAIVSFDPSLPYLALAGAKGEMVTRIGTQMGLKVVYESFPDRAYTSEGNLVPRKMEGAVIHDPRSEEAERGSADKLPAARRINWVHPGLIVGDAHTPGRDQGPGGGQPGGGQGLVHPPPGRGSRG